MTTRATTAWLLVALLLAAAAPACSTPPAMPDADASTDADATPPSDGGPMYTPSRCTAPNEAPLRDGDGGFRCAVVGSFGSTTPSGDWPIVTDLPKPAVYVRPGATGGDGSMDQPFGDLAAALAASPAAIVLARGQHTVPATTSVTGAVVIVGAGSAEGAMGTTLAPPAGTSAFTATGATARLTVRQLAIVYASAGACTAGAGVEVTGGARATLQDVTIRGAWQGVHADAGSTVDATQVSVLSSCNHGVMLLGGSQATLRSVLVRDGAQVGVLAQDSRVDYDTGLVMENGRDGMALLGGIAGQPHRANLVSFVCNQITGLRVERSASGAPAELTATRIAASGTRVPAGMAGGDGLYVGPGGTATVDMDLTSDAARGHGSELVGNARTGVLVDGHPTDRSVPSGQLAISGVLVGSNLGPGLYVQQRATAMTVAYSTIADNRALGVGVTSEGAVVSFVCNQFVATRTGALVTAAGMFETGDGLSMAEGTRPASLVGNEVSRNARFGAVFSGATATLMNNHGEGNLYGLGSYGSMLMVDATNTIGGASPAPDSVPQVARGGVAAAP